MTIKKILAAALLLPAMMACQNEDTITADSNNEPIVNGGAVVIKATVDNGDSQTRAQLQWDSDKAGEKENGLKFMWNSGDEITVYDISDTNDSDTKAVGTTFTIDGYDESAPSAKATFKCSDEDFQFEKNHKYIALCGKGHPSLHDGGWKTDNLNANGSGTIYANDRYLYQQTVTGNAALNHLKNDMKMYAIFETDENGNVPNLKFKHQCAMLRVTIRYEYSDSKNVDGFEFECGRLSNDKYHYSINGDKLSLAKKENGSMNKLRLYLSSGYKKMEPNKVYDLFFPILADGNTVDDMTINLYTTGNSSTPHKSCNITGFSNVKFEAGKTYWFDLTMTAGNKLEQTKYKGIGAEYKWLVAGNNNSKGEYIIKTPREMQVFAKAVNGRKDGDNNGFYWRDSDKEGSGGLDYPNGNAFEGKTIIVGKDLALSSGLAPIGKDSDRPFKGTFDGRGHILSGWGFQDTPSIYGYYLRIYGLFGYINGATIKNVVFKNFDIKFGAKDSQIGGIAVNVTNNSKIEFCSSEGTIGYIEKESGYTAGKMGGIACTIDGSSSISNCVSQIKVWSNTVPNDVQLGGLVHTQKNGTISNCAWQRINTSVFTNNAVYKSNSTSIGTPSGKYYSETDNELTESEILNHINTGATEYQWESYGSPKLKKK